MVNIAYMRAAYISVRMRTRGHTYTYVCACKYYTFIHNFALRMCLCAMDTG